MEEEEKKGNLDNLDTMAGIAKKKTIAGREYEILPVTIEDMHYILGTDEDLKADVENRTNYKKSTTIYIVSKADIEANVDAWQLFGFNIVDENRKKIFMDILHRYVSYKGHPMTEKLLIEHNWSFKEIGEFLFTWCQISD